MDIYTCIYMYHVFCIICIMWSICSCVVPQLCCHILAGKMKSSLKNRRYSSAYRKALNLAISEGEDEDLEGYRVFTCLTMCRLVLQGVCLSLRLSYAARWAVLYGPMPGDCEGGGEGCWTRSAGSAKAWAAVIGSLDEVFYHTSGMYCACSEKHWATTWRTCICLQTVFDLPRTNCKRHTLSYVVLQSYRPISYSPVVWTKTKVFLWRLIWGEQVLLWGMLSYSMLSYYDW